MSAIKCEIKYRKIEGNSELSTNNLLVAHNYIDNFGNIKDTNKFRLVNTELSERASTMLGKTVRLYEEENNKYYPVKDVFKELDNIKKQSQETLEKISNFYNYPNLYSKVTEEEYNEFRKLTNTKFEQGSPEELKLLDSYLQEQNDADRNNFNLPCI
jgi:hypothetical protein